jgi:hypothetical protein
MRVAFGLYIRSDVVFLNLSIYPCLPQLIRSPYRIYNAESANFSMEIVPSCIELDEEALYMCDAFH